MFKTVLNRRGLRENKTEDIVKRLGVITADRIHLRNYPIDRPVTAFNPGLIKFGDIVELYPRIVMGYFSYASAIARIEIPLEDFLDRRVLNSSHFSADIILCPDCRYDFWGTEDPRLTRVDDRVLMTYCGRTVAYFNPVVRIERTLPVIAKLEDKTKKRWRKLYTVRMPEEIRELVVSDKDAFIIRIDDSLILFHRPHMRNEEEYFSLSISILPDDFDLDKDGPISEVTVTKTMNIELQEKFENRLGWSTPPVKVGDEYLLFIHGVDRVSLAYRIFAILMVFEKDIPRITAMTPHYIMEPRMNYEIYGDRPYTIFPCGIELVDDELVLAYGAADMSIGIGSIDLTHILSILDENRID